MASLKYKVIASKTQYNDYCNYLEELVFSGNKSEEAQDEIDLLTLLIEKWDSEHNAFNDADPIRLLRSLMKDHKLKSKDLVAILGVSKGYVSEILHYKKGLSKDAIRILATRFKLSQEAFNRPYPLAVAKKPNSKPSRSGKTKRKTALA
jgi:HTH-type transcriptional regulator/antitoxin HigA